MNYLACKRTLVSLGCVVLLLFSCHSPSVPEPVPESMATAPRPIASSTEAPAEDTSSMSAIALENKPSEDASSEQMPAAGQEDLAMRLALVGIDDPQEAKDFLAAMKTAAMGNDRDAIASLIHYPFTTYNTDDAQNVYRSPAEFLSHFDEIVTDSVLTAMQNASYEDLFVNYQGAMIGNGEVWFMKYDEGIEIKSINSL